MFKCFECGHLFESGEERRFVEAHGEEYYACPVCAGAYEETEECDICGTHHFSNLLYNGICLNCIGANMTLNNMRQYLKDSNLDEDFFVGEFYGSSFSYVTPELLDLARGGFMHSLRADELEHYGEVGYESPHVEMMRKFIVDNGYGLYDISAWIKKDKEEKKCQKLIGKS